MVLTYIVYIGEIGDPYIIVEPEPLNNTFVSGLLIYNITCINTSILEIYINKLLHTVVLFQIQHTDIHQTNYFS